MVTSSPTQEILDQQNRAIDYELDQLGASVVPRSIINSWRIIDERTLKSEESRRQAVRLNSFSSLFYFAIRVLRKNRFQTNPDFRHNLHYQMCQAVMKDGLKEVIEIPRDHYKSTVYSECFPLWRALPFGPKDEDLLERMVLAGILSPLYLEWMRRAHNQDVRILIVSETIKNAAKLGVRVRNTYENNEDFRYLYPEILPDSSCTWTNESLQHKRTKAGSGQGEGTYDFIGVGGALQSRHYNIIVQDDLVGKDALKSELVMQDTIEYHKLLVGAFDADHSNSGRDNDEIVVGNRWSYNDLNSYLRTNESYFNFSTHSALGGCCALHSHGTPIFPEAFSLSKLARWRERLGTYLFSCQFLNFPINPEKCKFDTSRLRYFNYERDGSAMAMPREGREEQEKKEGKAYRVKMRHHVEKGDIEDDIFPRNLTRYMIIDPNHSGQKGRCRHAITITGVSQNPRRVYVLAAWAKAIDTNSFVEVIFKLAAAFKINTIHIETVAAQKYLKFHLEYYVQANKKTKPEIAHIRFADLKSSTTANAKIERIDSIIPLVERGELWLDSNDSKDLLEEFESYGNKAGLVDLLDTLGYGPQVWKFDDVDEEALEEIVRIQQNRYKKAMQAAYV